ncbi:MarR family transcriptional regulator [Paucilactobacillus hokkaidonensis JCM 18461]|uniref:MarR family transcriptional regulator n=2 Tax=Paucilactobacillus hokkaidonensis TaxID=1193095 RepID=A0A0A1GWJ3_9LACO|nr:MarR family winged helix-turn-helix transcriptional regulator [Paucilactobacillus hokkaidonensis]KRO08773.1 MarR family transcriptional regulator [Paucilactobacillus hokkaidonensis]BAP86617.1 MarR family transcriptional regulator [Paucilactobacillus hokkaidonensis JCM 18461]
MDKENELFDAFIKSYLFSLKYLQDFISAPAAEYGISFDQFLILREVEEAKGEITLMDVAEAHRVSRSAISRQISGLLDNDYVFQQIDPHDRRRKILGLTEQGKKVEAKLLEISLKRAREWTKIFGVERLGQVLKFIEEFTQEVVTKEPGYFATRSEVKADLDK